MKMKKSMFGPAIGCLIAGVVLLSCQNPTANSSSGGSGGSSTYTVTYNGNGNTSGTVPVDKNTYQQGAKVTVLGNTGSLAETGDTFTDWNTAADGKGTSYAANATFTMGSANVTLYAVWKSLSLTLAQGSTSIPEGGTYDFGTLSASGVGSGTVSFTITNSSSKTVNITGFSLTDGGTTVTSGSTQNGFNIDNGPSPTAIAAGGTATFGLSLVPSTPNTGEQLATVSISNDSGNPSTFTFTVKADRN